MSSSHAAPSISTPVAEAMDVDHDHASAEHHAAAPPAPTPGAHRAPGTFIPASGYVMPTPTWRVKPQ
jgi:hypothetical protein